MTPPIEWRVQVDSAKDNTFAQSIDDITNYVVGNIAASSGMADSYENVSQPATMTFTVSNRNGEWDREGYLSGERIVNGGFDSWTGNVPDGWSTSETGGVVAYIRQCGSGETVEVGGAWSGTGACGIWSISSHPTDPSLTQSNVFTPGRTYRISIPITRIKDTYSGMQGTMGLKVITNDGTQISPYLSTPVEHIFYRYITSGQTQLQIVPITFANQYAYVIATIDNVSVREVPLYQHVRRGMLCRLRAIRNGSTTTEFVGRITEIRPTVGANQEPLMSITVQDIMYDLLDKQYQAPLLTSSPTADDAITGIFDDPNVIAWPYEKNFWMLGVEGCSELGSSTYLYSNTLTDSTTLETGQTVFSYLGDRAQGLEDREDGVSAQGYIRDLTNAEFGQFFFNPRDGMFHFHNRQHEPLNDASQVTQTFTEDDLDNALDNYAEDLINQVTIQFTERTIGSSTEVIWSATNVPFLLKGNTSKKINARYFDATDNTIKISAKDYISPISGTDVVANTNSDGSGTDKSSVISFGVDFGASVAILNISNSSITDVYITLLRLRGTKLTAKDQTIDYTNWDSVRDNGLRPFQSQDIRLLDDPDLAEQAAQYQVSRFSSPLQRIKSITFNSLRNATTLEATTDRAIGDRITVQINSVNHDADYFIVGMNFNITTGGDKPANVTYILKPANRQLFWVLGVTGQSEMGETTILGF